MTSLRQAVQDYLSLRRSLGFKLRCSGALLLKFAAFVEARGTEYVTISLALAARGGNRLIRSGEQSPD